MLQNPDKAQKVLQNLENEMPKHKEQTEQKTRHYEILTYKIENLNHKMFKLMNSSMLKKKFKLPVT